MRSCSCMSSSCVRERSAGGTSSSPVKQPFGFGPPCATRRVPMKDQSLILKVTLLTNIIVLSIAVPVNHQLADRAGTRITNVADEVPLPSPTGNTVQVADGNPLPPPPTQPPATGSSFQVANGNPLPPPPTKPPATGSSFQVADGNPLPPPPTKPPATGSSFQVADGNPLPPPPTKPPSGEYLAS